VADTTYIVLRLDDTLIEKSEPWFVYRTLSASSAPDAIRKACDGDELAAATYVAVPARSWKPVTVKTETKTVIRLDTPKEDA
jgi:hypothetical protein